MKRGTIARTQAMNPFMSAVPRPYSRPPSSRTANGGERQSRGSAGTTSVWPERQMPATDAGPIVA
jgi:hypothetical protein